jgi:NADH:ubiquinone oxidoreductase subunit H
MDSIRWLLSRQMPGFEKQPEWLQTFYSMLASCIIILTFVAVLGMVLVWLELKVSAQMQDRLGPMYV